MRVLCLLILSASSLVAQVGKQKTEVAKPADFEASVLKIIVAGIGPAGYTSIGTGFFVNDHTIASAAHVYVDAAKAIIDAGNGTGYIAALKVFRDGSTPVSFPIEFKGADFAHDVVVLNFKQEDIKKQRPDFDVKPLALADEKLEVGEEIGFLGYYASDELPLMSKTTVAGFTAMPMSAPQTPEQIVLDLPANPGQSGSPVFCLRTGKVVGILASFVPVILVAGSLPTHSGLSRSVEVVHLKRLIESAEVR